MARLPYADLPNPDVPQANIFRLVANADTVWAPWARYGLALLRDTVVDPVVREQAILRVAALTPGAEYEWVQHEAIGRAVGMTDEQIGACRTGEADDVVLRFTEEVVRDAAPSDPTFSAMTERFSAQEIIELLLVIGQYMGLARIMATAQIDMDPPIGSALLTDAP
jgi:4-carboxymuconolactone decarboxylase